MLPSSLYDESFYRWRVFPEVDNGQTQYLEGVFVYLVVLMAGQPIILLDFRMAGAL